MFILDAFNGVGHVRVAAVLLWVLWFFSCGVVISVSPDVSLVFTRDVNVMETMNGSWVEFPRDRPVRAWCPRWNPSGLPGTRGIPPGAVKAHPGSGHDGLIRQAGAETTVEVNPVAGTELRCGHGATHHPWGWLGRWQREVPESLRWGHAEALCGFLLVLCLGLGTEPTAALAQHNSVGWPATVYVGTSDRTREMSLLWRGRYCQCNKRPHRTHRRAHCQEAGARVPPAFAGGAILGGS